MVEGLEGDCRGMAEELKPSGFVHHQAVHGAEDGCTATQLARFPSMESSQVSEGGLGFRNVRRRRRDGRHLRSGKSMEVLECLKQQEAHALRLCVLAMILRFCCGSSNDAAPLLRPGIASTPGHPERRDRDTLPTF